MVKVLIVTLTFISSNLVIKRALGTTIRQNLEISNNVCEECKFLNGQGLLRFFGLKIYQANFF